MQVPLFGLPLTLSPLLQESKPEQGLAGQSHSPGEQSSQLSVATRYSARQRGALQRLPVSRVVAQAGGCREDSPSRRTWVTGPGSSPACVVDSLTRSSLTWFPVNQMEAIGPSDI